MAKVSPFHSKPPGTTVHMEIGMSTAQAMYAINTAKAERRTNDRTAAIHFARRTHADASNHSG